jgi:hypothetical protein
MIQELEAGDSISPRERKLYVALTVIMSLNVLVISGVVTFFALVFK